MKQEIIDKKQWCGGQEKDAKSHKVMLCGGWYSCFPALSRPNRPWTGDKDKRTHTLTHSQLARSNFDREHN